MGKYEESIADFLHSLALDPDNPITYSNIGLVYRKMERFSEAIEYFSKEIELNSVGSKSYPYRAYCYVRIGLFHEAIQDYTMALKSDSKNLQYLHNRGVCF